MNLEEHEKLKKMADQIENGTLSQELRELLAKAVRDYPEDKSGFEALGMKGRPGEKSIARQIKAKNTKALVVSLIHTILSPYSDDSDDVVGTYDGDKLYKSGLGKTRKELVDFLYKTFDALPNTPEEYKLFGVSIETAIDYYMKYPEFRKSSFELLRVDHK